MPYLLHATAAQRAEASSAVQKHQAMRVLAVVAVVLAIAGAIMIAKGATSSQGLLNGHPAYSLNGNGALCVAGIGTLAAGLGSGLFAGGIYAGQRNKKYTTLSQKDLA